jgi:hypothetical protein
MTSIDEYVAFKIVLKDDEDEDEEEENSYS